MIPRQSLGSHSLLSDIEEFQKFFPIRTGVKLLNSRLRKILGLSLY